MTRSKRVMLALLSAAAICAVSLMAGGASGHSLQQKLDSTQKRLSHARTHAGVLTGKIAHESAQLQRLTSQVAALRNREAAVAAELSQKQAELDQAQARLDYLKQRLHLAIKILERRLVAIYESNQPDLITVLLQAHGFDDLLARTQYLETLQHQDSDIVARVRDLRNEMQVTVNAVRAARDEIAARKAELDATRAALKKRTAELATARRKQHATLMKVRKQQDDLEGDLSDISQKIAEQLGAGTGALPAGPIRAGGHGLIWPVNGPITSGYGPRNIGHGYEFHQESTSACPPARPSGLPPPGRSQLLVPRAAMGTTRASTMGAASPRATGTRSDFSCPQVNRSRRARSSASATARVTASGRTSTSRSASTGRRRTPSGICSTGGSLGSSVLGRRRIPRVKQTATSIVRWLKGAK
jgi:peptidoglycan DL-endopeptidase CwlO